MRLKRAIKRIVALGTGATMVGATILGAMAAADLSNYPQPFVEDGAFNALIVVGSEAKTEDVLGAIDIATSLQYSTTVTTSVPGTGTVISVVGEGAKVETDSNKVTINESLESVKTNFDEGELPLLLAAGTFVNDGDDESTSYAYKQKLEFPAPNEGNASVTFLRDRDYTDEDNPYVMLYGPKSTGSGSSKTWFMKYTLDFTKNAESDWYNDTTCGSTNELCDLEDTQIEILGVEYDVTKAERNGNIITWEMMGGVTLNTMYEGETKTFTVNGVDYEVTVDIISDTGSAAETVILTVNGQSTKELAQDQTQTVGGIEIGIKQVMGNEAGEAGAGRDLVQFYLGAQKVTLTDTDGITPTAMDSTVKVGGTTIDDLYVDWTASISGATVSIDKLELIWAPDNEVFIGAGESAAFPGLGAFEVAYEGMTHDGNEEVVVIEPHGDDNIRLVAPLEAGEVSVDILYTDDYNYTSFGESATTGSGKMFVAAATVSEGDYIVLTSATERESHIVEFDDISSSNITRLKDISDGTKYEASCSTVPCTVNVGDTVAVFTAASPGAGNAALGGASNVGSKIYTKEGLTIDLGATVSSDATHNITITEEDENGNLESGASFIVTAALSTLKATVNILSDTDGDWVIAPTKTATFYEYGDSENMAYYTNYGTEVIWDKSGDYYNVEIHYPGGEKHANVFVKSQAAVLSEGGEGSSYEKVQRIEVGAAVLDTEVGAVADQNTIVIGGPCANALAAELMADSQTACTDGFEMGKAMIKLFEQDNGNVALLVAGYSAMDTRRASRVVANHDQYTNFAGAELEVTGTSLSDIQVGVPTPAEEVEEVEEMEEAEE
jgi:hypothetical protein